MKIMDDMATCRTLILQQNQKTRSARKGSSEDKVNIFSELSYSNNLHFLHIFPKALTHGFGHKIQTFF